MKEFAIIKKYIMGLFRLKFYRTIIIDLKYIIYIRIYMIHALLPNLANIVCYENNTVVISVFIIQTKNWTLFIN